MSTTETKVRHTPGPWRWCGNYLLQDCPARDGGEGKETNPYSTPCGHPIADDGSAGDEYNATIDINGPDAHLIAAAPDMLEALEALTADAIAHGYSGGPIDRAEAAIAKAKGGAA